jgi:putative aldouronate transport system permease protein
MYGIIVAFKDFSFTKGILGSPWAANNGLDHFMKFFDSMYFSRLIINTIVLSTTTLIFSFPIPIIFALLLNEVMSNMFRRFVQSVSYFPYFVSLVITVSIMTMLLHPSEGVINRVIMAMGGESVPFMQSRDWFRPLYIISDIWQKFGWGSIIYMAALSGVSSELYEAAEIDGANRIQRVWHVSLPSILPTIIILLILAVGDLFKVGSEKILLMYSPSIYDVADVISTYVYRKSIGDAQFSFGAAVDLFQNVISFVLIFSVNRISRQISSVSLW